MWLASQVIFFGVAALLCSLIRFPFLSGVISLSVAPANLTATVHLEKKNSVTPLPTSSSYTNTPPPPTTTTTATTWHNNAFTWGMGNNVSSWSIWAISNIWIMLLRRNWGRPGSAGLQRRWFLGEVPVCEPRCFWLRMVVFCVRCNYT